MKTAVIVLIVLALSYFAVVESRVLWSELEAQRQFPSKGVVTRPQQKRGISKKTLEVVQEFSKSMEEALMFANLFFAEREVFFAVVNYFKNNSTLC